MSVTRIGYYTDNTGDYGWANEHADELAAQYPGKLLGVNNGRVVVIADTVEEYQAKCWQWLDESLTEGSGQNSIIPVPRREILVP